MEPLDVHIAVLAIGSATDRGERAIADVVAERATGAGHRIAARAAVDDVEAAIRAQLERWIANPDVDVVIAVGAGDSQAASSALRPLVAETIPGFTDLFRLLAFQEIGAAAMMSNAEAARCGSTFVFVLPASAGAAAAAMDKLILPQLDSRTTPRNLVTQMPRLQRAPAPEHPVEAVPQPVTNERTAAGTGVAGRLPANRTGKHVVSRTSPPPTRGGDVDEAVTKPIALDRLQREIEASERDKPTMPRIELANLPRVPPGADDVAPGDSGELGDVVPPPARDADTKPGVEAPLPFGAAKRPTHPVMRASTEDLDASDAIADEITDERPVVRSPAKHATTPPPPPRATTPPPRATTPPPIPRATTPPPTKPVRPTTPPPVLPRLPERSANDLPRGKFIYRPERRMSTAKLVTLLGLALLAAASGIMFVRLVFDRDQERHTTPVAAAPAPTAPTTPTPEPPIVASVPDAAATPPEIEIDTPDVMTGPRFGVATPAHDAGHAGHPATAISPISHAGDDASVEAAVPLDAPPDGCDEVSCVLDKYARPCCEHFRPPEAPPPHTGPPDTLDRVMVHEGVDSVKPRVIACGEQFNVKGTVKIAVKVDPDGKVLEVSVVDAPLAELGTCVATALHAAAFGKSVNGVSFTYPFVF